MKRRWLCAAAFGLAPNFALAQTAPEARPVAAALVAPGWRVADLDRSTRFYAAALGLKPCTTLHHGPITEVILCTDAKPRPLVILIHEDGKDAAGTAGGLDKLVIRVPDLAGVSARLKAGGYPEGDFHAAAGPAPAVLWVEDPDGHGLELLQGPAAQ